ncbi:Panacea domain-containing protein [Curtobacterium sp. NPDC092190]|uniref:Panacea domain-containing protein n=1 Tax=Curtobacterium sp. NPDC092190 TaxID=3363973 RepID=UPI00380218B6
MATVHDVAAKVLDHFDRGISTMKLQKLCYFAQGWSLGLREVPLFPDDFEAWRNGPVCYALFDGHRGQFTVKNWSRGSSEALGHQEAIIVDAVVSNYGSLSGLELSELTHRSGTPWAQVRLENGVPDRASSSIKIPQADMRKYFSRTLRGS